MTPSDENRLTLEAWAGAPYLNLTLVFTDIVDSTAIGRKLGDRIWIDELFVHFNTAREISSSFDSFVVKVIGDSLMMAFRTSSEAVRFALQFGSHTGIEHIGIRVGINSGQVQIRENDIYGLNVNLTSRVQHASPAEGLLVTNSVKRDFEKDFGTSSGVTFRPSPTELKSFGRELLYRASTAELIQAIVAQRRARRGVLEPPGLGGATVSRVR